MPAAFPSLRVSHAAFVRDIDGLGEKRHKRNGSGRGSEETTAVKNTLSPAPTGTEKRRHKDLQMPLSQRWPVASGGSALCLVPSNL